MNLIRRSSSLPHGFRFACRSFIDSSSSPCLTHGIHVFQFPDSAGIVAKLSDCIASRGGNILGADVFVPEKKNVFYSWSEFVFDRVKWPRAQMDEDFLKLSKIFNATHSVVRVPTPNLRWQFLLLSSNHERGPNTYVIRFLGRNCIPYHQLRTTKENKREKEILDLVKDTEFLVLARYMQCYGKYIINIHHGLLPSFKGENPSKQAFDAGVKLIGATSHFVTEELDGGPIIAQMVESVSHRENLWSSVQKSENLENQCLAKAMKSYCDLRVLPYEKNKTVVYSYSSDCLVNLLAMLYINDYAELASKIYQIKFNNSFSIGYFLKCIMVMRSHLLFLGLLFTILFL